MEHSGFSEGGLDGLLIMRSKAKIAPQVGRYTPHGHDVPDIYGEMLIFNLELRHVANLPTPSEGILTHHGDGAFFWFEQTQDHADQGGFPTAVGSNQTDIVILEHLEGNIFQDGVCIITRPKVFY